MISERETGELYANGENPIKRLLNNLLVIFDLPNHYSNNIVVNDSDFILTDCPCAIAKAADVSFESALAADFKRENNDVEFFLETKTCRRDDSGAPCCITITGKIYVFFSN